MAMFLTVCFRFFSLMCCLILVFDASLAFAKGCPEMMSTDRSRPHDHEWGLSYSQRPERTDRYFMPKTYGGEPTESRIGRSPIVNNEIEEYWMAQVNKRTGLMDSHRSIHLSPDQSHAVSFSKKGTIRIFDANTKNQIKKISYTGGIKRRNISGDVEHEGVQLVTPDFIVVTTMSNKPSRENPRPVYNLTFYRWNGEVAFSTTLPDEVTGSYYSEETDEIILFHGHQISSFRLNNQTTGKIEHLQGQMSPELLTTLGESVRSILFSPENSVLFIFSSMSNKIVALNLEESLNNFTGESYLEFFENWDSYINFEAYLQDFEEYRESASFIFETGLDTDRWELGAPISSASMQYDDKTNSILLTTYTLYSAGWTEGVLGKSEQRYRIVPRHVRVRLARDDKRWQTPNGR